MYIPSIRAYILDELGRWYLIQISSYYYIIGSASIQSLHDTISLIDLYILLAWILYDFICLHIANLVTISCKFFSPHLEMIRFWLSLMSLSSLNYNEAVHQIIQHLQSPFEQRELIVKWKAIIYLHIWKRQLKHY